MADLGSFGAAKRELDPNREKDTFTFCGKPFTVVGEMPPMLALQMAAASTGKVDESEGLTAVWQTFRVTLDEPNLPEWTGEGEDTRPAPLQQFGEFYKLAVNHAVDTEQLMRLALKLFEVQGGRPTAERSALPGGQLTTSPSSNSSYSDPRLSHLTPVSRLQTG